MSSEETEEMLERLTLAADSLPPGDERDGFMRELLEIRESLPASFGSSRIKRLAVNS
jgi:hypothetical protein